MTIQKKIQEFISKAQVNYDLPGLSAGVGTGDKENIYFAGNMDIATNTAINKDTVFHFASVSKLFVSTSILQLQDAGKVNIDDKLVNILPWIKMSDERYKDITVKHVLSHTSGIPDITDYHWDTPDVDKGALKRYSASPDVTNAKLLWDPGTPSFQYSNIGYELLGEVIEMTSGMNFEDYVRENILEVLGMNDSTFLSFRRTDYGRTMDSESASHDEIMKALNLDSMLEKNMAMPHTKDKNNHIVREKYYPYNRTHGPSSTLTSTITDIFKWGRAHLNKSIMSQNSYNIAWQEYATVPNNGEKMGLSWFKRTEDDYTLYGHEGSDIGFRSSFWICPSLDTQIIVLSNISKAPVKKINRQIFEILTSS